MCKNALAILAVTSALVLGGMMRANAATLDFDFSFSNALGTVTGEIEGLTNNSTGPASAVIIDSFPAALGTVCSTPCNTLASPWTGSPFNSFEVSNGDIVSADFSSSSSNGHLQFQPPNNAVLIGPGGRLEGVATFTATPLPAALPLFATGLGALGLVGWRRKRKARVSLLGAA
jgi:hypothetical protein